MHVYPAEIENALSEHPGVALAVAIGLPDRDLGAVVHAIVNLSPDAPEAPTAGELGDFLATRLARYKLPASYEFTDEPLRDEAGKVRRSQLRAERIARSEEHTSELQSLMGISSADFCLKKTKKQTKH